MSCNINIIILSIKLSFFHKEQYDDLWCVSKKVMPYEAKVENENTPQIMS